MQLLKCSAATPALSNSHKLHDFHSLYNSHSSPHSLLYKLYINSGYRKLFKLTPKRLFFTQHIYSYIYRLYVIYIIVLHIILHIILYIMLYIIIYTYLYYTISCILYYVIYVCECYLIRRIYLKAANAFMYTLRSSSVMPSGMLAWKRELSASWFWTGKL
jgi:hypothetical protein